MHVCNLFLPGFNFQQVVINALLAVHASPPSDAWTGGGPSLYPHLSIKQVMKMNNWLNIVIYRYSAVIMFPFSYIKSHEIQETFISPQLKYQWSDIKTMAPLTYCACITIPLHVWKILKCAVHVLTLQTKQVPKSAGSEREKNNCFRIQMCV